MIPALESARDFLASIDPRMPSAALAVLVGALIFATKKLWPEGFAKLPKKAQAYPALVLGAALGALSGTGDPLAILSDALFGGLLGGVTAVGGHHAGKRLKGVASSPAARAMVTILAIGLFSSVLAGCAWVQKNKDHIHSAIDVAAELACQAFVRKNPEQFPAARGVDPEELAEWACSDPALLDVFRRRELRKLERRVARSEGR